MAQGLINDSTLTGIAEAIRAKLNSGDTMLPGEMAALIESIAGGTALSGSVVGTNSSKTLNLGVSLPTSDNYFFYLYTTADMSDYPNVGMIGTTRYAFKDGVSGNEDTVLKSGSKTTGKSVAVDYATGTVTAGGYYNNGVFVQCYFRPVAYDWAYLAV